MKQVLKLKKDSKPELYKKWRDISKKRIQLVGEDENRQNRVEDLKPQKVPKGKKDKSELKTPDQIQKIKKQKEASLKKQKMKDKINRFGLGAVRRKLEIDGMKKKK